MAKEFIDLEGLTTFKNKYDEKLAEELATRDALIEELQEKVTALEDYTNVVQANTGITTLTYTTSSADETVQIAYINSYFESVIIDGEEQLDGTQSEDNADTISYTFAEAGEHTVYVKIIDSTDLSYLFYNCTALTSIGSGLFKNATSNTTFQNTFYGCSGLTSLPDDLFRYNTAVTTFRSTFQSCSGLTSIPSGLFDNNTAVTNFYMTFRDCNALTSIPSGLFDNNTEVKTFQYTFGPCNRLTSIPEGLFDNNTKVTSFASVFECYSGNGSLTSIPSNLFANCPLVTSYNLAFYGQVNLTGETPVNSDGLKLWELAGTDGYPDSITGTDCFYNCTGLDDYDEIDDDWK